MLVSKIASLTSFWSVYGDYFGLATEHGLEESLPCHWVGCSCGWRRSALNNFGGNQHPMKTKFSGVTKLNSNRQFRNGF
jgi:hypothetical protein